MTSKRETGEIACSLSNIHSTWGKYKCLILKVNLKLRNLHILLEVQLQLHRKSEVLTRKTHWLKNHLNIYQSIWHITAAPSRDIVDVRWVNDSKHCSNWMDHYGVLSCHVLAEGSGLLCDSTLVGRGSDLKTEDICFLLAAAWDRWCYLKLVKKNNNNLNINGKKSHQL